MIASIRHNFPFLYRFILFALILSVITVLSYIALIVISQTNNKISSLASAIFWESRAVLYDGPDKVSVTPAEHFVAEIKGLRSDRQVVFSKWGDGGFVLIEAELADLDIVNFQGAKSIIDRYKGKKIFVDYYQYSDDGKVKDAVVLWDEFDAPINAEIVERHFAKPVETPPTNIVNTLMAKHFWKLFKEG